MKKILLITTGGTIASGKDPITGRATSGKLTGAELLSGFTSLEGEIELEIESAFQYPSNHMDFAKLQILKSVIKKGINREDIDGIVVTHGTDTIEESSYFISLTVKAQKNIVLTGSQRTPHELGTDAYSNIRDAIAVAASDFSYKGVFLVFNQKIFDPKEVYKNSTFNVNGFCGGELGYIDNTVPTLKYAPTSTEHFDVPASTNRLPEVLLIKAAMGMTPSILNECAKYAKGLVLEGFGRGHVPPEWVTSIEGLIQNGVKVLMTSSCRNGPVYQTYEFNGSLAHLNSIGVEPAGDLNSKKARVRLFCALASQKQ